MLPEPPAGSVDHDGRTVSRGALFAMRPEELVRLRFDDGTTWEGAGSVLLGREPASQAGEGPMSLYQISDSTRSVSKTHLLLTTTTGGVQIVDRHSSNGTEVVAALDSGLVERETESGEALGMYSKVHLLELIATEVHDAAVAQADEVLGRQPGRLHVVDAERGHSVDGAAEADDGFAERAQQSDL